MKEEIFKFTVVFIPVFGILVLLDKITLSKIIFIIVLLSIFGVGQRVIGVNDGVEMSKKHVLETQKERDKNANGVDL